MFLFVMPSAVFKTFKSSSNYQCLPVSILAFPVKQCDTAFIREKNDMFFDHTA